MFALVPWMTISAFLLTSKEGCVNILKVSLALISGSIAYAITYVLMDYLRKNEFFSCKFNDDFEEPFQFLNDLMWMRFGRMPFLLSCCGGFLWLSALVLMNSNFDKNIGRSGHCCIFLRFFFILLTHATILIPLVAWTGIVVFSLGIPKDSAQCDYDFWLSTFAIEIALIIFTTGHIIITIITHI